MLDWYEHLYIGMGVRKKADKYIKKLDKGKLVPGIYLITLAANPLDQLDIISSYYLLQNAVYRRCPMVVGLAKNYEEACELLVCMVNEAIHHTGNANIKEYLLQG